MGAKQYRTVGRLQEKGIKHHRVEGKPLKMRANQDQAVAKLLLVSMEVHLTPVSHLLARQPLTCLLLVVLPLARNTKTPDPVVPVSMQINPALKVLIPLVWCPPSREEQLQEIWAAQTPPQITLFLRLSLWVTCQYL